MQDLESDWLAALTPGSSELEAAARAAQQHAVAAPTAGVPAGPFAAAAAVGFEAGPGTLPTGGGLQRQLPLPPGRPAAMPAPDRQGSSRVLTRAGSASINIPYHNMRRAETAPALTDDLIAAAMAASATSSASGQAKAAAAAVAAASGSSAGSSYRGSPPKAPLATLPERRASATREVFEAQAEAVAALTQAKVLQQALSQVRERGCWGLRCAALWWAVLCCGGLCDTCAVLCCAAVCCRAGHAEGAHAFVRCVPFPVHAVLLTCAPPTAPPLFLPAGAGAR